MIIFIDSLIPDTLNVKFAPPKLPMSLSKIVIVSPSLWLCPPFVTVTVAAPVSSTLTVNAPTVDFANGLFEVAVTPGYV
jgi:hypothetical protein